MSQRWSTNTPSSPEKLTNNTTQHNTHNKQNNSQAFDLETSSKLVEVLRIFDSNGDGMLDGDEVSKVADLLAASREKKVDGDGNHTGEISIRAFPEAVRESIAMFDLDNSGFVDSSELISGAKALLTMQKENRRMKIAIVAGVCILVIFSVAMFAMTFTVIKITEQVKKSPSPPPPLAALSSSNPSLPALAD